MDQYQIVTLVLSNGQRVHYTGIAQIDPAQPMPKVVDIIISTPQKLPDGMTFGKLIQEERKVQDACVIST